MTLPQLHFSPARRRMDTLIVDGRRIRRQPPWRIEYCLPPTAPAGNNCAYPYGKCSGESSLCLLCGRNACQRHAEAHTFGLTVPPDAWRSTFAAMQQACAESDAGRRLFRRGLPDGHGPVVRVSVCRAPTSRNVDLPCGYPAATCQGTAATCTRCLHNFCQRHLAQHQSAFWWPRSSWLALLEAYRRGLAACAAANGKTLVKARAPPLKVPHG